MNFYEIIDLFRSTTLSETDKGNKFERLIKNWFKTVPLYRDQIKDVWLWSEFPYRKSFSEHDIGIDLVVETLDHNFWAVQCKCYAEGTSVQKHSVDSFLSCVDKKFSDNENHELEFSYAFWVDTASNWSPNARESILNRKIPFRRIDKELLNNSNVNWDKLYHGENGKEARNFAKSPFQHQIEAVDKAREHYVNQGNTRGKLIMACGTGKTYTALKIAEDILDKKGLVLFMVPSIALLGQTLNAWKTDASFEFSAICVCSDSKVSKKSQNSSDIEIESVEDLAYPACTSAESIKRQILKAREQHSLVVVFSTYQSVDVVAEAQKLICSESDQAYGVFDFIICDEAHRTTGVKLNNAADESYFIKIHSDANVSGKKRLYMTATPRLYGENAKVKASIKNCILCSMDDESIYGKEFYRVGFTYAVEHGLLTDYKVLVLTMSEDEVPDNVLSKIRDNTAKEFNTDDTIKLLGVINGLSKKITGDKGQTWDADPGVMRRAVAFCRKIGSVAEPGTSKNIEDVLPKLCELYKDNLTEEDKQKVVDIKAHHVDGGMNAQERGEYLSWLNQNGEENECKVLTNVRCLSEGVDVPALDAIIFLSSRNSQVDVVQSVGRVMRNFHRGQPDEKKYGYIIIPIVVPADVKPEDALDDNERFAVVWDILNALRSHDESFNACINSISLNKNHNDSKVIIGKSGFQVGSDGLLHDADPNEGAQLSDEDIGVQLNIRFGDLQQGIYARLVEKCGDRLYWENWAGKVGKIAQDFIERISRMVEEGREHKTEFDEFVNSLRKNLNPEVTNNQAVVMLAQHMVTKPVFDALFEEYNFSLNNVVSQSMQQMLDILTSEGMEKDTEELRKFYENVRMNVRHIDNLEGKQTIIKTLYEKFFKLAFPKTTEQLGIVYTPVECVDFIINSVNAILNKEFSSSLSSEGVHILDPFAGTGTFIVRLLQSGLIRKEDLIRKYTQEIHCNEIVLLAYYVADINIEAAFHALISSDQYIPYNGICLTDTFQLNEEQDNDIFTQILKGNTDRMERQKKQPIMVCFGNPPYSAGQKSANDNAQNLHYPNLEKRLASTYAANTKATNKNSLYDSYIKAFRWASDRILLNDNDRGVIAFISNGGWLDGNAMDGMRKCLEDEFSSIYVLNLRGNQRTSGELSRKEGGKIFGSGSRTPVTITILVRKPKAANSKAVIYYHDIGDYLSREEKLKKLSESASIESIDWKIIKPNEKHDWINQRNSDFDALIPLGDKNNKNPDKQTVFNDNYTNGLKTNRDSWCYNSSSKVLESHLRRSIDFYNQTVDEYEEARNANPRLSVTDFLEKNNKFDSSKFSWDAAQKDRDVKDRRKYFFDQNCLFTSLYRPFYKQVTYFNRDLNNRVYQLPKIFPHPELDNLVICVSGVGDANFSCLISNCLVDLHLNGTCQCFPLYYFEKSSVQSEMFNNYETLERQYIRKDGITDWFAGEIKKRFNLKKTNKKQIFYYIYGLLHSKTYRKHYAQELKKSLPRIPIVDKYEDYIAFAEAGKQLSDLHLNYENRRTPSDVTLTITGNPSSDDDFEFYKVIKMKYPKKGETDTIIYNSHILIENIPQKAYEYVINGKSAIDWIMERYQITQNKESLIINDPNDWSKEHNKPKYILDLLVSIITVSMETAEIVNNLPQLKLS